MMMDLQKLYKCECVWLEEKEVGRDGDTSKP